MLRLLALVPYPAGGSPSQRFRIEQWQPDLEHAHIRVSLVPFADARFMDVLHQPGRRILKGLHSFLAVVRRLAALGLLARSDAVLVHRGAFLFGPALVELLITVLGKPLIFDFDDAIYLLHTTEANRTLGWLKFPGKTAAICRTSRHVVVANEGLADFARRYNPRVSVIPSSVDTDLFRPLARPRADGPLRVGWTGSSTSLTYLEGFAGVLRELLARLPIELHVHSDRRPVLGAIPFAWHPWSPDTEVEALSQFDVGIMPMPDDDWARGKSAMKALLYMAMEIPAVCSAVGTNRDVIRHGENGLLVLTPEDWLAAIRSLVEEPARRTRLGRAGRLTVEERYSRRVCAAAFAEVVREVAS